MKKCVTCIGSEQMMRSPARLIPVLLFIMISTVVYGQLNIPLTNCQNLAGTYTDLGTNGTVITTANFDDANAAATNIGFTFNFNGVAFTQFVLNTNGFIRLGSSPPSVAALFFAGGASYTGGPFNSTSTSDINLICAFNHDLTGGTSPEFRVYTSGTAPNRICVIQFKNMRDKTTSPAIQFDNISFQIHLHEGSDIVEIVYGTFTPSVNTDAFKSAVVGLKGSGSASGQMIAVTKGSTTIYSATTFLAGNYPTTGNAFNFRKSVLPDLGRTLRFMPIKPNDRAIMEAYTMGKSPIPFGNPLTMKAWVKNGGTNSMTATTCTLNITGANTFNNVQTVPALLSGDSTLVTFAPFSPTITGTNTVEVTIPSDDNPLNNVKTKTLETNLNSYSYAQGPQAAGGVGFSGATGDFVAKFTTNSTQSINQVNVQFANGGQPFQIGIWSANTSGTPGTLIHTTPTYTSITGVYTVLIDPPVSIPVGSFFVGVRQTATTNVSFGYQTEAPIRSATFYFTSPTGSTSWTDFAPGNPFRFMIEPKFALGADVGVSATIPGTGLTLVAGQTYSFTATVVNYGQSAQNNIPVYYNVNNGTPKGPVTTTTSIIQNASTTVNFTGTNAFTPATAGTYTLKFFTQLTNDLSAQNDTLTVILYVLPAPYTSLPYTQKFTNPVNWTRYGVASLWNYGLATGATGQTNDTAAFADFYGTSGGNSALLKSPAFNITSLAHPAITFDVAYRTKSMESDTLQVLVSTDGGITFVPGSPPLYMKATYSNPPLPTLPADTADFFPSAMSNWRKETVSLQQFSSSTNLMVAFRAGSGNGNNCWVDNFTLFSGNLPTVTTAAVSNVTMTTASCGGNVTAIGSTPVIARGVCWSTTPGPTINNSKTVDGSGTGTFNSNISGLSPNTPYYIRAYATNGIGTAYGNELNFTSLPPPTPPTVLTVPVTSITHHSAVAGGDVTSDGGSPVTARGVCWSINPNPTISDAFTNEGPGMGAFSSTLTGLDENTTYYVKAFATNTMGISYGDEESFVTLINSIDEPNPAEISINMENTTLCILAQQDLFIDRIMIIDMTGKAVAEYLEVHCNPSFRISMEKYASGSYIVSIMAAEKSWRNKIWVP